MTGKRDVQPRLRQLLTDAGFRVAIMRSRSVKSRDRLDWIKNEGKRSNIVISHAQLVQTGVDFFGKGDFTHNFNAIAFYETGYNPFTMQQAARRAWQFPAAHRARGINSDSKHSIATLKNPSMLELYMTARGMAAT
jgi:hypothetical protein